MKADSPNLNLLRRRVFAGLSSLLAVLLLASVAPDLCALDHSITREVWRRQHNVSEAQTSNQAWLDADADFDGLPNGAEMAAGTNPFSAGSVVKISEITADETDVQVTFPTVTGKHYVVQRGTSLAGGGDFTALVPSVEIDGTGGNATLTAPKGAGNSFFRVLVQDMDTDGDDASDWAELALGYNPNDATTYGGTTEDGDNVSTGLATSDVVTVIVTKPLAVQPPDAGTAALETGSITVSRGGPFKMSAIVVPLTKGGTAIEGTDYDSLPNSLTFAPGVGEIVLPINPKANASRRTNVTAIVRAEPGNSYTLGAASAGGVVINPAGVPNGTGLTGQYFNNSSATYTPNQLSIFNGTVHMTRVDPIINFPNSITNIATGNPTTITTHTPHEITTPISVVVSGVSGGSPVINGTYTATSTGTNTFTVPVNSTVGPTSVANSLLTNINGWGLTGGPKGMSPASGSTAFSVRWTGQILPQYSEKYFIDFRSDDSAKVWVDGKLLIDRWVGQGATDYINSIDLKAGLLYDIKIEYWNSSSSAQARLYWWSDSQTKQIVPQGRLFPAVNQGDKMTAVTSSLAAVGYEGQPFSFAVKTADIGAALTFTLDSNSGPLPPGLNLSTSGMITGTPTQAGVYSVAVNAFNGANVRGSTIVGITIYPTGGVSREILATTGGNISDLVIPVNTVEQDRISTLDDDTDHANNVGKRLRGYLIPPKTGNYYFWIAASNAAELWISNNHEYVNKVLRASVTGPAGTGKKTWNTTASQQSPWLTLEGGRKYYFEVLHNSGAAGDDHVSVGWCQDDAGTIIAVAGAPNATGATTLIPNGGGELQGYPLSGTVPSYIFQPYDYPSVTPPDGELYACNLGPQGGAQTSANGSANLRLNAAGTQAILHFNYQNLTSPRTAYHLHVDAMPGHTTGEIIFDIDDADAFPPELRTEDGGYVWNLAPSGTFTSAAQILQAIQQGKVYLNVHSVTYPAGEIRGTLQRINGSQTPPDPALYQEPSATDVASSDVDAARFLNQASFGASPADVAFVKANGFAAWIDDQLTKEASHTSDDVVANITADINQPYPVSNFTNAWWKYAITGQDQLRQRLAFALSEIMVVSWQDNTGPLQNNGRILADYYDQLQDYCLPQAGVAESGSFRGILKAVTLTPAMGLYLDMRGNQKGDITIGRHPNENYAREIMQLFSIGIYRQWDDGKYVLDSEAGLVPTYLQPSIIGLSSLFTGWNYAQANQGNGRLPSNFGPAADYLNPMVLVPSRHELAAKLLLNNVMVPEATGLTPRVSITGITPNPGNGLSLVNVAPTNGQTMHGLTTGDTVRIAGVTGGNFGGGLAAINATHQVTVLSPTTFTVPVSCAASAGVGGTVTGAKILPSAYLTSGLTAVSGSQADNAGTGANHPYDLYGLKELELAIDNIVNNDNVAPYICRLLIQRFVTSDPSPGYLYRVVQKFKNNGSGVRGDMTAVIKQILLDGEARRSSSSQDSSSFGKQREPMLRLTGPARAFPATNYTGTYTQLSGTLSNRLQIVTSAVNDFSQNFSVSLNFRDNYTATSPPNPHNNPTSTTYAVAKSLGISGIAIGTPCTVTTPGPHGLVSGDVVTISGVSGGSFSGGAVGSINATHTVTVLTSTTFQPQVNCTSISGLNVSNAQIVGGNTLEVNDPALLNVAYSQAAGSNTLTVSTAGPITDVVIPGTTLAISSIDATSPCTVNTTNAHNLTTGNVVSINSVSGGTFSGTVNTTHTITVTGANSFTIPINCTEAPDAVGSVLKTLKAKVYLDFLNQASGGGAAIPADSVYVVQTRTGSNFTVTTSDTPGTARSGNVLIPRVPSSYTPMSSNTVVQFNTNVNHSLQTGNQVWVDAPVVTSPLYDAEYTVTTITDEDHFRIASQPTSTNGGVYPNPAGSNNSVVLWPLVPPPTGRTGVVTINQSTFNLGSTEGSLTQSPLNAPTVFNFFYPDYKFPGSLADNDLDSPEFQLTTDSNVMNLTNSLTNTFLSTGGGNGNVNGLCSFNSGNGSVVLDLGPYIINSTKAAEANIPALVDELANLLVGAPLTASTRTAIINFVNHKNGSNVLDYFPYTTANPTNVQKRDRVRAIIHLIITSAEYAVQK